MAPSTCPAEIFTLFKSCAGPLRPSQMAPSIPDNSLLPFELKKIFSAAAKVTFFHPRQVLPYDTMFTSDKLHCSRLSICCIVKIDVIV